MCFRQLTGKNPSSITNTAAAIVRQAVAIVFEHAASSPLPTPGAPAAAATSPAPGTPSEQDPASPRSPAASVSASAAAESPQAQVVLTLLREVCRMARGRRSELLECPPPAVTFLFEVLGDALREHVHVFRHRAAFVDMLREDVCGAIRVALKGQMDTDGDGLQVWPLACGLSLQTGEPAAMCLDLRWRAPHGSSGIASELSAPVRQVECALKGGRRQACLERRHSSRAVRVFKRALLARACDAGARFRVSTLQPLRLALSGRVGVALETTPTPRQRRTRGPFPRPPNPPKSLCLSNRLEVSCPC